MEPLDPSLAPGIRFVVTQIRETADRVEKPTYDTFHTEGRTVHAISRMGQPDFARKLRAVAEELERLINDANAGKPPI